MVPTAHPSHHSKRHIELFSRFCETHERDQQTDRASKQPTTLLDVRSNKPLSLNDAMRPINAVQ